MTRSPSTQLKTAILKAVQGALEREHFALKASTGSFERKRDDFTDIFMLVFLDGKPGLVVRPSVGIRSEQVEAIFHMVSGFNAKDQKTTTTIGSFVGEILDGGGRSCQFLIESSFDIDFAVQNIVKLFNEFALGYFEQLGSLEAIDRELNESPNLRTPNRGVPWMRAASGIIVARLVHRKNFDEVARFYGELLKKVSSGFYFNRFEKLLQIVETIP